MTRHRPKSNYLTTLTRSSATSLHQLCILLLIPYLQLYT